MELFNSAQHVVRPSQLGLIFAIKSAFQADSRLVLRAVVTVRIEIRSLYQKAIEPISSFTEKVLLRKKFQLNSSLVALIHSILQGPLLIKDQYKFRVHTFSNIAIGHELFNDKETAIIYFCITGSQGIWTQ